MRHMTIIRKLSHTPAHASRVARAARRLRALVLVLMAGLFALTACSEDDGEESEYSDWQARNTAFFAAKYQQAQAAIAAGDTSWKVMHNWSYNDSVRTEPESYVVAKVLEQGSGTVSPLYTDSVYVSYRGYLIHSNTVTSADDAELGTVFDQSFSGDYNALTALPVMFQPATLVDGFTTALLQMHTGDRWKIYIPYQLGYGTTEQSSIPAYSTLVFDVAVVGIYHPDDDIPPYRAKKQAR